MTIDYRKGLFTGILISICGYIFLHYSWDLVLYYLEWFVLPKTTDSIEAGPIKITLSNATDWMTVFKMMFTVLGTYAGIKVINKVIK